MKTSLLTPILSFSSTMSLELWTDLRVQPSFVCSSVTTKIFVKLDSKFLQQIALGAGEENNSSQVFGDYPEFSRILAQETTRYLVPPLSSQLEDRC